MEASDIKQFFLGKRCEIYLKKNGQKITGKINEVKRWSIVVVDLADDKKGPELIDIDQIARIVEIKGE